MSNLNLEELWKECNNLSENDPRKEKSLLEIINSSKQIGILLVLQKGYQENDGNFKIIEKSILAYGNIHKKKQNCGVIVDFVKNSKSLFCKLPRAKTAKILKLLIDMLGKIPNSLDQQLDLCEFLVAWCEEDKRNYLRQRIQIKMCSLYQQMDKFIKALELIELLLKEVRKQDDKHLLVEIQLIECKVHQQLENHAKAKSSLTAARACANSIYCPPLTQADIDMQTGILHAHDQDYKTSYSYFYESFEAFNQANDPKAIYPLKYMILSKIMNNQTEEVNQILNGKFGMKYQGRDLDAMKEIAKSHLAKSIRAFQTCLDTYSQEIKLDPILNHHIQALYENLLEQNLFRIIEPYSRVQIDYIVKQINLPLETIQNKLSEIILDKKIDGTLDQGNGCLIIFEKQKCDNLYEYGLNTIENMNLVIDKLFEKAALLKK